MNKLTLTAKLHKKGIPFIDNRNSGGSLWVKGGEEMLGKIERLEKFYEVKFTFREVGSDAFNGEKAWFTKDMGISQDVKKIIQKCRHSLANKEKNRINYQK